MSFNLLAFLRTRPLERTVVALLALAFLLLAASVGATGWLIQRTESDNDQVANSYQARALAATVLTDTIDAETGQRGYLLTGRPDYLDVTRRSAAQLDQDLQRLHRLTAADPDQQARVDSLKVHIDRKFAEMRRSLELYDAGRRQEALDLVLTGFGHAEMVRIRAIVAQIEAKQTAMLAERRRSAEIANARTLAANTASAVLIVGVGVVVIVLVWRYIEELRASRAELDVINRGLEVVVAERTAELVAANEEVRRARDRAEALLREVNHRVANSLQIVSHLVQLQAKGLDEAGRRALSETLARIQAVAQVHRRLYTRQDVERVDLHDYLSALADELQQSLVPSNRAIRLHVDAAPLCAPTDRAVSLGVMVTELVTNAVKYAFPDGQGGEIRIRLAPEAAGRAMLTVEDDGVGLREGRPEGTGLGSRILKAMAGALGSKVEYDLAPGRGLRARVMFAV